MHAGTLLSTFWQCGEGYRLSPESLDTLGIEGWVPLDGISAHPKVDLNTGELMFFNYSTHAPYMHYGVVSKDNQLQHYIPVDLPAPRLPHDMAISEHYSVLNDFPLYWPQNMLEQGFYVPYYDRELPARFGVLPRFGQPEDLRWFEAGHNVRTALHELLRGRRRARSGRLFPEQPLAGAAGIDAGPVQAARRRH